MGQRVGQTEVFQIHSIATCLEQNFENSKQYSIVKHFNTVLFKMAHTLKVTLDVNLFLSKDLKTKMKF